MVTTEPGKAESYLESATVFWDYYMFDDAERTLRGCAPQSRQFSSLFLGDGRHL